MWPILAGQGGPRHGHAVHRRSLRGHPARTDAMEVARRHRETSGVSARRPVQAGVRGRWGCRLAYRARRQFGEIDVCGHKGGPPISEQRGGSAIGCTSHASTTVPVIEQHSTCDGNLVSKPHAGAGGRAWLRPSSRKTNWIGGTA